MFSYTFKMQCVANFQKNPYDNISNQTNKLNEPETKHRHHAYLFNRTTIRNYNKRSQQQQQQQQQQNDNMK